MEKQQVIKETIEKINDKQGETSIVKASEIEKQNVKPRTKNKRFGGNKGLCSSSEKILSHTGGGCKVRDLKKDEIECKVSTISKGKGLTLLLYKTARTDILILDETFGQMNWQCEYREIKGNMYCGISVFDAEKNQWVTKWDCGVESAFGDKQKGEASDAFKRAGFKWGIGIELYTAPFIWIPKELCNITDGAKCYDKFVVEKIATENKIIEGLAIRNITTGKRVFVWQNKKQEEKQ